MQQRPLSIQPMRPEEWPSHADTSCLLQGELNYSLSCISFTDCTSRDKRGILRLNGLISVVHVGLYPVSFGMTQGIFASPWSVSQSSKLLHHLSTCCPTQVKALQSSFSLKDLRWASWTRKRKSCCWQLFSGIYFTFLHWLRDRKPGRADAEMKEHGIATQFTPVPAKMAVTRWEKSPGLHPGPRLLAHKLTQMLPSLMHPLRYHPAVYWSCFTTQWDNCTEKPSVCVMHQQKLWNLIGRGIWEICQSQRPFSPTIRQGALMEGHWPWEHKGN